MPLIDRLEAVITRLEELEQYRSDNRDRLMFSGALPVLLDLEGGHVRVHIPDHYGFANEHTVADACPVMSIEEWRHQQANPIAMA